MDLTLLLGKYKIPKQFQEKSKHVPPEKNRKYNQTNPNQKLSYVIFPTPRRTFVQQRTNKSTIRSQRAPVSPPNRVLLLYKNNTKDLNTTKRWTCLLIYSKPKSLTTPELKSRTKGRQCYYSSSTQKVTPTACRVPRPPSSGLRKQKPPPQANNR